VIDVGVTKPAWVARYGDQVCGPLSLKEAKAAALEMDKGAAGDYLIADTTGRLNGLAARLLDAEATTFEWRTEHSPPLPVHGGDV
jgi:hypothetical protein